MAKRFGFFNSINGDRKYLATDLSQAFDVGITTGLKADNADNFKIVPNANMQVKMMPGGAMIFGHYLLDEEEEIINLDMADAELNRIDRIVLRYDKFERSIKSAVIKGTAALTPVAPAALRTNEQFDLVLADIYIGKAVTTITTANITDMRESDLCGFIGVKGATSQIAFNAHVAELAGKHIKESGSNANGSYIKFDDGTMECWHNATVKDQVITDLLAAPIYSGTRIWTYPASFVGDLPTVAAGTYRYGSGGGWGSCWSAGLTNATMRCYDIISRAAGTDTIIGFRAIGRWK